MPRNDEEPWDLFIRILLTIGMLTAVFTLAVFMFAL